MKILFNILAAVFLLISSCSQKVAVSRSSNHELKVLTYNIHHANPPSEPNLIDIDAIVRVIKNEDADLVALQELDKFIPRSENADQAKIIALKTGLHYHFFKAIDYQGGEYGVAIFSKLPIKNTKQIILPKAKEKSETRTLGYVEVEHPNGKRIVFACTHLCVESEESRTMQVKAILKELGNLDKPVILCGDFNASVGSQSINLLQQEFRNSCIDNCGLTVPADVPKRTIDYILFKNANWEVKNYAVVNETYASDHRPVAVVFNMNP